MISEKTHTVSIGFNPLAKIKDYAAFTKFRLATLVLFSAFAGYYIAVDNILWTEILALMIGGFLVTGSSNGINQIIEKDLDKLMNRTENRPLPTSKMSVYEGIVLVSLMGLAGIFILWYFLNPLSGLLGALALLIYTSLYTPLKRISPWAVFVGAIPGAIPPMLGAVAASGEFGLEPGILFAIQFVWQFPHFWAIAWKVDEDYAKAGFRLLPSKHGKDKKSALQIMLSAIILVPVSLIPVFLGMAGTIYGVISLITGAWFAYLSVKLYRSCDDKDATKLMFASFIYLPIVLIAYAIDKL